MFPLSSISKLFRHFQAMSALAEEIANVKAVIARYEAKLETVTTTQRESDITRLITASRENLTVLLQQQLAASAAPVGKPEHSLTGQLSPLDLILFFCLLSTQPHKQVRLILYDAHHAMKELKMTNSLSTTFYTCRNEATSQLFAHDVAGRYCGRCYCGER